MAVILNIETATRVCSVAISENEKIIGIKESSVPDAHSSVLTVFIEDLLQENSLTGKNIDAIAVSMGPGSYTGLRIGVAVAKGLCYAWEKPLIAVNTLQAMADLFIQKFLPEKNSDKNLLLCPMIDARRMEVYCALFNHQSEFAKQTEAVILNEESFKKELDQNKIYFFGDGAEKCKSILQYHANAFFVDSFQVSALGLISLSSYDFNHKNFKELVYFEPFYLKDFVAKLPGSKI